MNMGMDTGVRNMGMWTWVYEHGYVDMGVGTWVCEHGCMNMGVWICVNRMRCILPCVFWLMGYGILYGSCYHVEAK